jgi:3-methyladenine DNA glycosylase Mpg
MERRRKTDKLMDLARGPGRLARALEIDRRLDGIDMCAEGPLWLGTAVRKTGHIGTKHPDRHHPRGRPVAEIFGGGKPLR